MGGGLQPFSEPRSLKIVAPKRTGCADLRDLAPTPLSF